MPFNYETEKRLAAQHIERRDKTEKERRLCRGKCGVTDSAGVHHDCCYPDCVALQGKKD